MYCVKCGVELADSEHVCPLCGTVPYHPDLPRPAGESSYPSRRPAHRSINRHAPLYVITLFFVIVILQLLLIDLRGAVPGLTWSYYAAGGLLLCYILAVLPLWFRHPNPVIFVPCDFAAVELYLLGINLLTNGGWFLSFAFPVVGILGLFVTALIALLRYVRRGQFFIWGGAAIALGGYISLLELFVYITFDSSAFYFWSLYPMTGCALLGLFLIFVGICRPLREALEKKFFL